MRVKYKREKSILCPSLEVDTNGVVYGVRGKPLKPVIRKDGYAVVCGRVHGQQRMLRISRLVATQFIPNPNGNTQVNHKNGDKLNNSVANLEWVTPKQNMQHSIKVLGNTYPKTHAHSSNGVKPVMGFNDDNKRIYFPSVSAAGRYFNKITGDICKKACISRAIRQGYPVCGYRWLFISKKEYKRATGKDACE